jgi:hypothetical protein
MRADLSREQYEKLFGADRLDMLAGLEDLYFVSGGVDDVDNILQWRTQEGQVRQVDVTGPLDEGNAVFIRSKTPPAFLTLFDAMVSFHAAEAKPYVPEAVEVRLSPMNSSWQGKDAPWPSDWSAPVPAREQASEDGVLLAVLPGARFAQAYQWLSEREGNGQGVIF